MDKRAGRRELWWLGQGGLWTRGRASRVVWVGHRRIPLVVKRKEEGRVSRRPEHGE